MRLSPLLSRFFQALLIVSAMAFSWLGMGGARWQLLLFALVSVTLGLYLCNGLGPKFGLGEAKGRVDRRAALGAAAALAVLVVVELLLASES